MNERLKSVLIAAAVLSAAAACTGWWYANMEKRWQARPHMSDAARENRMLGATMLLRQSGHQVTVAGSLGEVVLDSLADGTLIVGDASGVVAPDKAQKLLAWVRRGNTLVAQPRWASPAEAKQIATRAAAEQPKVPRTETPAAAHDDASTDSDEDDEEYAEDEDEDRTAASDGAPPGALVEVDPLAAYLGVRLRGEKRAPPCKPAPAAATSAPATACTSGERSKVYVNQLVIPGAAYPLDVNPGGAALASMPKARVPAWSDQKGGAVRLYTEGRGRIVMVAADYFNNYQLRRFDHGQLLVALASLHGKSKQVMIVKNLDMPRWYRALWDRYSKPLSALALMLGLLLWAAVRRFGPLLPEADRERRSLIEHIDASGAWLWNAANGRATLLDAARADTLALLQRRAPALLRLPPAQRAQALAQACRLHETDVDQALQADALSEPQQFTRQIRTLQILRNHYER